MRIVLFSHTLRSDWNHGNAHFLRGIVAELAARGHDVTGFEPEDSWSARNLAALAGEQALEDFRTVYPAIRVETYDEHTIDLEQVLHDVDLALVHEWNSPTLVAQIGQTRARNPRLRVLFHDTHHRSVTDPGSLSRYDLSLYDGVLAFGESVRERYLARGWAGLVWTWHEAADTRVFCPVNGTVKDGELVWIGNWGDGERSAELCEFLIEPVRQLGLRAKIYGVRYPAEAMDLLARAGIGYGGWLPNYCAPEVFARYRVTVHVPRGPYAEALHGVPTIRMFEALACGIPLVSAPWEDSEHLFPENSYRRVANGSEMCPALKDILHDELAAQEQAARGLEAILQRHTCAHRVNELMHIYSLLSPGTAQ